MTAADDMPDSDQSAAHRQRPRGPVSALPVLTTLVLLSGCAVQPSRVDPPPVAVTAQDVEADAVAETLPVEPSEAAAEPAPETEPDPEVWTRLRSGFRLGTSDHPRVQHEIRRLQRSPNAFRALMARSEPYLNHILNAVEAADLPTELALLPAVESGFRPQVYSPDGAAGLWQFMPATGRMLGLRQDWWFDKRRTVRASTEAAVAYLQQLEARFSGDWLHALAAYNAGTRKVSQAIRSARRRGEATDFWSLDLPGETDRYVPRLLALAAVVADPESYGLDLPEIPDRPYFAVADTDGQIDLNVAAGLAGIPVEELLALNAGHKRWTSRPDGPHELLLPLDKVDAFQQALSSLPAEKRLRWRHHRVQRGESLGRIARDYRVSVEAIRQSNGLSGSRIRAGEELIIPLSDAIAAADTELKPGARQRLHYRVRKGDSLYTIARRFQVSVAELKRWNRVGRYIRPGDRLTLFIEPEEA